MTKFALTAALMFCGLFAAMPAAQAAPIRIGVGVGFSNGGVHFQAGGFDNQRYVQAGMVVVYEPYFYTRRIWNASTGRVEVVKAVGYNRRQVWLYLDTWTNSYFYFDSAGNLLPYRSGW